MNQYVELNNNPKGKKTDDCVVRAISYASGLAWEEVFDLLCKVARKKCTMPNSKPAFTAVLKDLGFVKQTIPVPQAGESRPTVSDVARWCKTPAVLSVAGHLVAVDGEGHYVDIWDCGKKCCYTYWIKG